MKARMAMLLLSGALATKHLALADNPVVPYGRPYSKPYPVAQVQNAPMPQVEPQAPPQPPVVELAPPAATNAPRDVPHTPSAGQNGMPAVGGTAVPVTH